MNAVKRALVAVTMMALTLGVASMPALSTAAHAAPADPAACTAATQALANANADVATAKNDRKQARKKLKKAKKAHARKHTATTKAKVKKARKKVASRTTALEKKQQARTTAEANRSSACADEQSAPSNPSAFDFGSLLGLLTQVGGAEAGLPALPGAGGLPLDASQLTGLLSVLSGSGDLPLDAAMLTDILGGLGSFDPDTFDPATLTDLLAGLSGGFDPAMLTDLLGGELDPAVFMELFATGLSALTGGADLPIPTDPTAFLDLFQTGLAALTGQLDAGQLGELFGLLSMAGGFGGTDLDVTQFAELLTGLFGGTLPTEFSPDVIADMLAGFSDVPVDPAMVMALFGGLFSPDQLTELLAGGAGTDLLGTAFATLLAQFGSFTGGTFEVPDLSTEALEALVTSLTTIVTDLIDAVLDGLGLPELPGLCVFPLPILCS